MPGEARVSKDDQQEVIAYLADPGTYGDGVAGVETMSTHASLIFLARLNSAEGDIGDALTLPAITAVLIGGTSLFGGVGTMFGTFVGALLLTLIVNGMNLLAVSSSWQPLVTGVILIAAVWLDMKARGETTLRA